MLKWKISPLKIRRCKNISTYSRMHNKIMIKNHYKLIIVSLVIIFLVLRYLNAVKLHNKNKYHSYKIIMAMYWI